MNIELPKDAEGREIPLNTTALYDKNGSRRQVDWFKFYPDKDRWDIVFKDSYSHFSPSSLSLTKPDSWEKLEEDLGRICSNDGEPWFCNYANESTTTRNICQENCKFFYPDDQLSCRNQAVNDIVSRIRKLSGEDE